MMSLPTRLIWRFWRRGCLYWLNALIHPKIFTYWQIGKLFFWTIWQAVRIMLANAHGIFNLSA